MARDLNRCDFIGRVGREIELRYTEGGKAVGSFSLAVNDGDNATWINVVAWEKLAEIISQYATKGKQIYISGRLANREWEDKEGNKRTTTEIVAREMQLLGTKGDGEKKEIPF